MTRAAKAARAKGASVDIRFDRIITLALFRLPNPSCDIATGTVLNLTAGAPMVVNIAIDPIFVGTFE